MELIQDNTLSIEEIDNVNLDIALHYADKVITELRTKWINFRNELITPTNLVCLNGNRYLFLSTTALCETEHEVLISSVDWGYSLYYAPDKVEKAIKEHFIKRAGINVGA